MSAVAGACRQQSNSSTTVANALQIGQQLTPEGVVLRTPKSLAEMKLVKERQAKQQLQQRQPIGKVEQSQQQQSQQVKISLSLWDINFCPN